MSHGILGKRAAERVFPHCIYKHRTYRRYGGHPRFIDPLPCAHLLERSWQLFFDERQEFGRGDRLKTVLLNVHPDHPIELTASDCCFKSNEKHGPLVIGYPREGVVRVGPGDVWCKRSDERAALIQKPLEVSLALPCKERTFEHHRISTEEHLCDALFGIDRPAFVQPEMPPIAVGNQVARPRMSELVRDNADHRFVACNERRRKEGQRGI